MKKIDSVCVLTLGTSAQTVRVSGLACMVQNNSESASVYMKERRADGEDVTADNGWRKQLLSLAAVLTLRPRVLLLDEL